MPETARRPTLGSYTSGNGYFWTGVTFAIVVIVLYAILSGYTASLNDQVASLDGQLDQSEKSRDKQVEQLLMDAQKQSSVMRSLLSGKIYWSQALSTMEQMTQSSVTFTRLVGSVTDGTIKFSATAPDYATVARQIAAFSSGPGIRDVSIDSVKTDVATGDVVFDGALLIDTRAMLNKQVVKTTPTP